jgi:hypothetical protein
MSNSPQANCIDDDKLLEDIKKYGLAVMLVEATDYLPSFGYTVGLWKNYHHPELIAFGLTTKTLHSILNIGGELVKDGQTLKHGFDYDNFFDGSKGQFIQVDNRNIRDYFGYAIWFNQTDDFPALQLVWTDRNNDYPWNKDFEEEFLYRQPLLDRNADFKYREAKNLAVFTTRQWLEDRKPILRVVHDEEGDWQFLTADQTAEDAKIVALEQMTLSDPTLNDVFNLDYGEAAERNFIGDKWGRSAVSEK